MVARSDWLLVAMAAVHAAAVLLAPSAAVIAAGLWWNSNTIAHNFIHRPFFRSHSLNRIFSATQSVLIGVPQALWRERHLAHHAGAPWRLRCSRQLLLEVALVLGLWMTLATVDAGFFATVYAPGYLAGLVLCAMQGHFEHVGGTIRRLDGPQRSHEMQVFSVKTSAPPEAAQNNIAANGPLHNEVCGYGEGGPVSHYGRVYNLLCFNDGYHVEHHAYPGVHWSKLPDRTVANAAESRWPALLRWLDHLTEFPRLLDALERLVLRRPRLQQFVLRVHRNAFRALLAELPPLRRVAVVGGGLFPRTALVLRDLAPGAEIVVIEANRDHVNTAKNLIDDEVAFQHAWFSPTSWLDVDLLVIPLAFKGDRRAIYRRPPAPAVLVHDWAWCRRGRGRLISLALLKRLNLVRGPSTTLGAHA